MNGASPLVFRASAAQRAVTVCLAMGCLLVSVRGGSSVVQNVPKVLDQLKLAQSLGGESTALIWLSLAVALLVLLVAGVVSVAAVLLMALVEGTQVFVDEYGITVDCPLLPGPLARRLGAGRIPWQSVTGVGRRWMRFVVVGDVGQKGQKGSNSVGFLFADQLERLVLIIVECSPNLKG